MEAVIAALSGLAIAQTAAELRLAIANATPQQANPAVSEALRSARARLTECANAERQEPLSSAAGTAGDAAGHRYGDADDRMCVVCLDAPKSHLLVGCMHKCVCGSCAELLLSKDEWRGTVHAEGAACPVCRLVSKEVRKVFE
mmetsp:Transcript_4355/g.9432  ORF Transcript_4355/g.9432 Transcript_4355/m.9432 type:complete len:143 (+) Transcript_4355:1066-1494(+)